MNTFSQVVQATLASVKAQAARAHLPNFPGHVSHNLIVRHAMKHAESAEPGILRSVVEAVRDALYYERIGHGG
jgi:hypothetical protein